MQKSTKKGDFSLKIVTLGWDNAKITDFKPIITFSERNFIKYTLSLQQEKKQNDFINGGSERLRDIYSLYSKF